MATNSGYSRVESEAESYGNRYHDESIEELQPNRVVGKTTLSERQLRKQWWKNAFINLFFIAAWCVAIT